MNTRTQIMAVAEYVEDLRVVTQIIEDIRNVPSHAVGSVVFEYADEKYVCNPRIDTVELRLFLLKELEKQQNSLKQEIRNLVNNEN